ncbi:hypothetical protein DRW07_04590 [Alteromonas sediminis]|uniref:STAS/SEC14 domain-containing protein n=1 Tax=Alteromonas sediminis TaxID=2259342 RepID=A0A3N5ZEA9_9ALTE|nr:hypothetical protein [Alteromonas sediminis]RPJ68678.1 hypothetical protein DRW07_04590 [Alteromonas sediminis]
MIEQNLSGRLDFGPHGHFSLETQSNLIRVTAVGPGNREVIQQFNYAMRNAAMDFNGHMWATQLTLEGLPLMPPDATELLVMGMIKAREHGHIGTAVILEGECNTGLCKSYWQDMFMRSQSQYQFCQNQAEALAFIEKLFSA